MRTSEQIKAEIEEKFGFFPPFFEPAQQNPQVFENLWQQTLFAYVSNPLSPLFKEKLSAYLSRYCAVPYCMICHSCSLRPLGVKAREVLELIESPPPTETDIDEHLRILAANPDGLTVLPANLALEESLLYCSIFISLEREQAEHCRTELRRILGAVNYQHLVAFIAYIKTCHAWMEAHPEIAYATDKRVIDHLSALVEDEPGLAEFFRNYSERVRQERQSWAGRLAEIAERKRQEEALRKAAAVNLRLARAIASVSDGVAIADPTQLDTPIIYSNPAFSQMTGYQPEEIIGRNCRFLQGTGTDPEAIAQIRSAIAQRREVKVTLLNYRKDGQPFWNELRISPVFSDEGDLLYFIGIQTDISERKQAEESLRQSEQRFRFLAEAIPQQVWTAQVDGALNYFNERVLNYFGRTFEEMVGWGWQHVLHPDDVSACIERWSHSLSTGEPYEIEFRLLRKADSSYRWHLGRASPLYDDKGRIVSWFGTNTDIDDRKQTEAMLMERSRLSTLAAEIGIALAQSSTLPELLRRCMEALVQHLNAANACVWTFNPEANLLELRASIGQSSTDLCDGSHLPLDNIIGSIAQTRQPYTQNTEVFRGAADQGFNETAALPLHSLVQNDELEYPSNFAGYPLIMEERLVGVMALQSCQPFTEAVQSMLGWVANGIAVAIDRAWAREELLSRREDLLFRLASQICNSLDLDTILATTVHEIRSLLQIDCCYFLWCDLNSDPPSLAATHEAAHDLRPSLLEELPSLQIPLIVEKIRNLETVRIDDIGSETSLDVETQALLSSLNITSQLLLPLKTHSGQLGAVVCIHCSGPRPWTNSEVELLQAVVDQLATAIDQAELYAQTRATALAAQTQARQLELALRNLKQTQAQLIQTEKMSSLGQMVAGIAHEINNPVSFISGNISYANEYIQDLLDLLKLYQRHYPSTNPEIQAKSEVMDLEFLIDDLPMVLSSMKMGADRIRQIVLSLRNFSRLDEAEMKPVDIHEGIDNTLLILQNRLKEDKNSGIQIVKEYGDLPLVECYAGQLNQVFMNVLSNAIDALENQPHPRTIAIHTEISPPSGVQFQAPNLVIRIRDNGPGMTEAVRKQLFDPFFTTKPVGKGTGLGLSISYQIVVEKHGGIFKCFSEPGQGAEFWIQIPITPLAKLMTAT